MTRSSIPYVGAELEQYEEAMRLVPAILKLRELERSEDVERLLNDYQSEGLVKGVGLGASWAILFVASSGWAEWMFAKVAEFQGNTLIEVLDAAISSAADWAGSGI